MIRDERDAFMVYWDFAGGAATFWAWGTERINHAVTAQLDILGLLKNLTLYILVGVFTEPGKFTLMTPWITSWAPTIMIFNLISAQIVGNIFFNDYFAQGNVYVIVMQVFTL